MSSQSEKIVSATKPPDQTSTEMELKLTQLIEELKTNYENKNLQSILNLLRELKKKYINSKSIVRSLKETQGLRFLVTMLMDFTKEYIAQPVPDKSQLISLLVGILGNCCIQSNSVQSTVSCILYSSTNEIILYKVPWCSTNEIILYKVPWCSTN